MFFEIILIRLLQDTAACKYPFFRIVRPRTVSSTNSELGSVRVLSLCRQVRASRVTMVDSRGRGRGPCFAFLVGTPDMRPPSWCMHCCAGRCNVPSLLFIVLRFGRPSDTGHDEPVGLAMGARNMGIRCGRRERSYISGFVGESEGKIGQSYLVTGEKSCVDTFFSASHEIRRHQDKHAFPSSPASSRRMQHSTHGGNRVPQALVRSKHCATNPLGHAILSYLLPPTSYLSSLHFVQAHPSMHYSSLHLVDQPFYRIPRCQRRLRTTGKQKVNPYMASLPELTGLVRHGVVFRHASSVMRSNCPMILANLGFEFGVRRQSCLGALLGSFSAGADSCLQIILRHHRSS